MKFEKGVLEKITLSELLAADIKPSFVWFKCSLEDFGIMYEKLRVHFKGLIIDPVWNPRKKDLDEYVIGFLHPTTVPNCGVCDAKWGENRIELILIDKQKDARIAIRKSRSFP